MAIDADYLGGDPSHLQAVSDGKLESRQGTLSFTAQTLTGSLTSHAITFEIEKQEIRAISVGDANHMKAITRTAVGAALGGSLGAVLGAATGRRNHVLMVAGTRDGFEYYASFSVRGDEGSSLLNAIQAGRRERGEPPLPRVEQLADLQSQDLVAQQLQMLGDIRGLLMTTNELLGRLVVDQATTSAS